ncbi:hypothetical protein HPP92_024989 [Vanilla planifolia]|uniref:Uncharacterized protein n=1 Tax=Vanilla planifolia TaxID=51239 RepID=A0A835PH54_VANPL|nr:hypothetical protein HPP92_024989 [Vanilla planifolia]
MEGTDKSPRDRSFNLGRPSRSFRLRCPSLNSLRLRRAFEIGEVETRSARADVNRNGGGELGGLDSQAEPVEDEGELVDCDLAVSVMVEDVEDAAEAERVKARAAKAEGAGRATEIE